jgi:large subunit ribosomal protein L23
MTRPAQDVLVRPLVMTEKGNRLREAHNQVLFEVVKDANKAEIKKAVAALFRVTVLDVRTLVVRGKMRRMGRELGKTRNWKKAIVTLKEGDKIEFFETQ